MLDWLKSLSLDLIISAALLVAAVVILLLTRKKGTFTTRIIVFAAISLALATILNFIIVYSMPNGGSITAGRLVPLLLFAYAFGARRGFIIGLLYGLLDFIAKPYFSPVNPVAGFLLDYALAFSFVGLVGVFKNFGTTVSLTVGAIICGIFRFFSSSVSGTLCWGLPFPASMAYNTVILIDSAVCVVILLLLSRSKGLMKIVDSLANKV